jgi:hypothetical protein
LVNVPLFKGETGTTILQIDARIARHQTAAPWMKQAIDE